MKPGDRVIIQDHSDAHGNHGTVWLIQNNGVILVELDPNEEDIESYGVLWPVDENELKLE